jgi:2-amino-4-hydroxy-6-hydroxymethyldihydropteridine diphosphokinase
VRRAFIGLGANLGDRARTLAQAVSTLRAYGDVAAVSPVYETEPQGGPAGQPAYLNAVVALETSASARELLERCRRLEHDARRVRTVRDGPRTLDADVLLVGDEVHQDPELEIPHPRMWQRRFVLAPLRDVAPDLVPDDALARAVGNVERVGTL